MTMDKLFDGSDAHLLPGNAELIQRLRYERDDDERYEAADALEAADKRIAELEAAMVGWRADQKENIATAVEECKRANEAERKLDVAREALSAMLTHMGMDEDEWNKPTFDQAREALAQIGGDDAGS